MPPKQQPQPQTAVVVPGAPPVIPTDIPPQSASKGSSAPPGPPACQLRRLLGCHDASNLAFGIQANMTAAEPAAVEVPDHAAAQLFTLRRMGASMMGFAGRDPVFQAQRESETLTLSLGLQSAKSTTPATPATASWASGNC